VLNTLIQPYVMSWRLWCGVVVLFFVFVFFCKNHIIYGTTHFLQKAWHLEIRGRTTHNYMFPAAGKIHFSLQ